MLYPHTHKTIRQYVVEELKNILDVVLKRQDMGAQSECSGPLREISRMINHREPAVLSHPLLSVLKTSDVEVTIPDLSGGRARCHPSVALPAFSLLLLLLLGHRSTPT
ncbi:hypothetical protein FJT64_014339 [Amphibalanus amphitrite]|uniref:Uncharacterized protein n=1 Tax=Amphibalanus amphitrite TaxID=1232801 RepID=A0A6A4UZC9_AMPAM|nr:hypothetical protein FJT64_014339 [Amphibalanus amphitrite]